jgi:hypothetical protein
MPNAGISKHTAGTTTSTSKQAAEGKHRDGQRRRTGLPGGDASLALYTHSPRAVNLTTTIESRHLCRRPGEQSSYDAATSYCTAVSLVTGQRPLITAEEGVFTRVEADAGNHGFPP